MTLNDVIEYLKEECEKAGSQVAWAKANKISPGYVADVIKGHRGPGDMILTALGVKRVTSYERVG